MRKTRFTEEQIIQVLKAAEVGEKATDLCRRHGISEQTFYRWKAKYGGMEVSEARRLRQLEDENRRLKHARPRPCRPKSSVRWRRSGRPGCGHMRAPRVCRPYASSWCWIIWLDISPMTWYAGSSTMG